MLEHGGNKGFKRVQVLSLFPDQKFIHMHFVIFTGGGFQSGKLALEAIQNADKIVAADSGAEIAVGLNIIPTVVIGDFDSLSVKTQSFLKEKGCRFITSPKEKNETDTNLAINYAVSEGASKITILGGTTGDRFDHILSNLLITAESHVPIRFIDGRQESWIETGPKKVDIKGKKGDLLSLIPISRSVDRIQTQNLYYPLKDESLFLRKTRGVSNVFVKSDALVSFTKGILLFVHTYS